MLKHCLILLALLAVLSGTARAQGVLLTEEEALREIFPKAARIEADTVRLAPERIRPIKAMLQKMELDPTQPFKRIYDASGTLLGYTVVLDEMGKHEPITFMTALTPELEVERVVIMAYREDRGGEVRTPRFLYQYRGKDAGDPIRPGRDIINVSGATISVKAVSSGVKRALLFLNEACPVPAATN